MNDNAPQPTTAELARQLAEGLAARSLFKALRVARFGLIAHCDDDAAFRNAMDVIDAALAQAKAAGIGDDA